MKLRMYIIMALAMLTCFNARAAKPAENSIVRVIVTYQQFDPYTPWQKRQPGTRYGYGVLIGKSEILTTESLVRNNTLVELREARSGKMIPASVVMMDQQANLALLKVKNEKDLNNLKPIRMATNVPIKSKVKVLQFDETTQVQSDGGQIIQALMTKLPYAAYASLTFKLRTNMAITDEGNPVIHKNRLAGLVMVHNTEERLSEIVPYPIINHFLADAHSLPYKGFASAGFRWKRLVDPTKRQYLNAPENDNGILILSCLPHTGAARALKPNDIVLEWDGHPIDNLGFYQDKDYGRMVFSHLIKCRREPGDSIPVKIIRNKKQETVEVELSNWSNDSSLIPENDKGDQAEYLVEGGLVIRELTGNYLRAHGGSWRQRIDPRLVHMYMTLKHTATDADEHIVILSRTLPDPINKGYEPFGNEVITHLNGKPVKCMSDVFKIADKDGHISRVTLKSVGVDLVLDKDKLDSANESIKKLYRLPSLRHQK